MLWVCLGEGATVARQRARNWRDSCSLEFSFLGMIPDLMGASSSESNRGRKRRSRRPFGVPRADFVRDILADATDQPLRRGGRRKSKHRTRTPVVTQLARRHLTVIDFLLFVDHREVCVGPRRPALEA